MLYLLVGLVGTFGVANLGSEIILLLQDKVLINGNEPNQYRFQGGRKVRNVRTRIPARYANWVSVSTFILTTPLLTAVLISSEVEPEPPWKTR